jgi:pSer/pThr/pTyr-binding forkhead associated (FHA) protein
MLTVTPSKQEFKLGRGHESEVRINDISVSRCHAIIKYKKDGFYMEDNLSKFGTIVLIKEKLRLSEDHTVAIQVGRSVVSFTIKSIDAREKLKREIEPLLNRNRNKVATDHLLPLENNRINSQEHHVPDKIISSIDEF